MPTHLKPHLWFTLYTLLRLGAAQRPVAVSTTRLGREMGVSQQSASRHLLLLEEEGLVERRGSPKGTTVKLTEAGVAQLERVLEGLKWHLEEAGEETMEIVGEVTSGLFEGAYYVSKEGYSHQMEEKLGFKPFPGTLNLKIEEEDYAKRRRVESGPYVHLEGFRDGTRAFGAARCYPCLLEDRLQGALIVAERSIHDYSVMEIVSPHYLRRELGLADGDKVKVSFLPLPRFGS